MSNPLSKLYATDTPSGPIDLEDMHNCLKQCGMTAAAWMLEGWIDHTSHTQERLDNFAAIVEDGVSEALGCYPSEDAFDKPIEALYGLQSEMKGDKAARLAVIIQQLEDEINSMRQSSEYGIEKLNEITLDE